MTSIRVEFTEPVQPLSSARSRTASRRRSRRSIIVEFGPPSQRVRVPFTRAAGQRVRPVDATTLTPVFNFPGEGPPDFQCGVFNRVDVTRQRGPDRSTSRRRRTRTCAAPRRSSRPAKARAWSTRRSRRTRSTSARSGAVPGISVIDLNGFGQSTGIPALRPDATRRSAGGLERTNFPNNPNVRLQGSVLRPPLAPGHVHDQRRLVGRVHADARQLAQQPARSARRCSRRSAT